MPNYSLPISDKPLGARGFRTIPSEKGQDVFFRPPAPVMRIDFRVVFDGNGFVSTFAPRT